MPLQLLEYHPSDISSCSLCTASVASLEYVLFACPAYLRPRAKCLAPVCRQMGTRNHAETFWILGSDRRPVVACAVAKFGGLMWGIRRKLLLTYWGWGGWGAAHVTYSVISWSFNCLASYHGHWLDLHWLHVSCLLATQWPPFEDFAFLEVIVVTALGVLDRGSLHLCIISLVPAPYGLIFMIRF